MSAPTLTTAKKNCGPAAYHQEHVLNIDIDYMAADGRSTGAMASALEVVRVACAAFGWGERTDVGNCATLSAQARRIAQIQALYFVPKGKLYILCSTLHYHPYQVPSLITATYRHHHYFPPLITTTHHRHSSPPPVSASVNINTEKVPLSFSCDAPAEVVAEQWCADHGLASHTNSLLALEGERVAVDDPQKCVAQVTSLVMQTQAGIGGLDDPENSMMSSACAMQMEDLLDAPLRDTLSLLQYRTLHKQNYLGVETWKVRR
jgi:hypothetical protein